MLIRYHLRHDSASKPILAGFCRNSPESIARRKHLPENPRGVCQQNFATQDKPSHSYSGHSHSRRGGRNPGVVREVGFEPTNPCGTGASGLRIQDPSEGVSLTWLGNTSGSRPPPTPALFQASPRTASKPPIKALIAFPHKQSRTNRPRLFWKNV